MATDPFAKAFPPERDGSPVICRFRYLVCTTPRTGGTLLCRALKATQQAGIPREYFHINKLQAYKQHFALVEASVQTYLEFLYSRCSTPNGVFGSKLVFRQLENLIPTTQKQIKFLQTYDRFIMLSRRSKIAQAVSLVRATQAGVWGAATDAQAQAARDRPLEYDEIAIARGLNRMLEQEAFMRRILSHARLPFLQIFYEDLIADFQGTMRAVLHHLDIPSATILDQPPTVRIGDSVNEKWAADFRAMIG